MNDNQPYHSVHLRFRLTCIYMYTVHRGKVHTYQYNIYYSVAGDLLKLNTFLNGDVVMHHVWEQ